MIASELGWRAFGFGIHPSRLWMRLFREEHQLTVKDGTGPLRILLATV